MTFQSSIRKIYFGVADRRQMYRLFDRHAQRPDRWQNDDSALFAGEWFEIARAERNYMLDILPPLWMRGEMFALARIPHRQHHQRLLYAAHRRQNTLLPRLLRPGAAAFPGRDARRHRPARVLAGEGHDA